MRYRQGKLPAKNRNPSRASVNEPGRIKRGAMGVPFHLPGLLDVLARGPASPPRAMKRCLILPCTNIRTCPWPQLPARRFTVAVGTCQCQQYWLQSSIYGFPTESVDRWLQPSIFLLGRMRRSWKVKFHTGLDLLRMRHYENEVTLRPPLCIS